MGRRRGVRGPRGREYTEMRFWGGGNGGANATFSARGSIVRLCQGDVYGQVTYTPMRYWARADRYFFRGLGFGQVKMRCTPDAWKFCRAAFPGELMQGKDATFDPESDRMTSLLPPRACPSSGGTTHAGCSDELLLRNSPVSSVGLQDGFRVGLSPHFGTVIRGTPGGFDKP